MLRRLAVTMLLATATSVLAANQPGEARRNRAEAVIPPLVLPPLAPPPQASATLAPAATADEIDEQAQIVELAAPVSSEPPSWSIAVAVDARTRCALGPSVDCLANDARLRAVGIVLDPDEPANDRPPAPDPASRPSEPRADGTRDSPRPMPSEAITPSRPRSAALRALTPEFVAPSPTPAPHFPARERHEPSGVVAPMQWRIAPQAWIDLRPRTELELARGRAASVPAEPLDGGRPVSGAARVRLGVSVPLEAFRGDGSKPLGAALPPPGVARLP